MGKLLNFWRRTDRKTEKEKTQAPMSRPLAASHGSESSGSGESNKSAPQKARVPKRLASKIPRDIQQEISAEIQDFTFSHRYASGLRVLLGHLDRHPNDEFLLQLAEILAHSGMSQGNLHAAAAMGEELKSDLLKDQRLDAIFSECHQCPSFWVTNSLVGLFGSSSVLNPLGGRCRDCGGVFCRECLGSQPLGADAALIRCPKCGGAIEPLTEATGRRPRQARRHREKPLCLVLLRDGPVPPDDGYVDELLGSVSPDSLEHSPRPPIMAVPEPEWSSGVALDALSHLRDRLPSLCPGQKLRLGQLILDPIEGVFQGDRYYLLRVFSRDGSKEAAGPFSDAAKDLGAAGGILMWFDWTEISKAGHRLYGRYVYERLLPFFAPETGGLEAIGHYALLDGDCLNQNELSLQFQEAYQRACVEEVKRRGTDVCYVVAIHGVGPVDFSQVDLELRKTKTVGYLGLTTSLFDFEEFYEYTGGMSLAPSLMIMGSSLNKISFGFLTDAELGRLGFTLGEMA